MAIAPSARCRPPEGFVVTPWTRPWFAELCRPGVIGMLHLGPLPGSPGWGGDLGAVTGAALLDARTLREGGIGALMLENFHDIPFQPGSVPPVTVAAMTFVAAAIRRDLPDCPLGINVLRNDAEAALGIAVAVGAAFIRVNVHTGAAVTDQGVLEGRAWQTLRQRREYGAAVGILADVRVKHAVPLGGRPLVDEARDLRLRGLADAVIVTGAATGAGADPGEIEELRRALPDCPLLVGSGVGSANVERFVPAADGFIVGTSLKEGGDVAAPVSAARMAEFLSRLAAARKGHA
ncbi:MAG: BtpA/SgcQ family protein [bacterium]|nr:BtpA/SgcQ family protein [bacterium]